MNALSKKTITGAIGAIALAGAMAVSSAPAQAGSRNAAWFAGGVAAGVIGGALVANSHAHAYPAYGYGYAPACWREARPVYDVYGNIVGYRKIRVCN
ncbi:MAG: hypothetical protein ACK4MV_02800 [Beijerinckiaceae bacterium]